MMLRSRSRLPDVTWNLLTTSICMSRSRPAGGTYLHGGCL